MPARRVLLEACVRADAACLPAAAVLVCPIGSGCEYGSEGARSIMSVRSKMADLLLLLDTSSQSLPSEVGPAADPIIQATSADSQERVQLFTLCVSLLKYGSSLLQLQSSGVLGGICRFRKFKTAGAWVCVHDICNAAAVVLKAVVASHQASVQQAVPAVYQQCCPG
jgi:hypothetical protein